MLQFDWINPEEFTNYEAAVALESFMIDMMLLDPVRDVPFFDREALKVCVGDTWSFNIAGKLRHTL